MQEFTTFDIVIIAITVFLGLKGLFKGFIKEAFGLIGIVGGIFVASNMSQTVGKMIQPILGLENEATISLIGFIVGLIAFWFIIYIIGIILSKVTSMSGLGIIDRFLGFVFGGAKVFLIFSIIAYALYQVDTFKKTLDKQFEKSMIFPLLVSTGSYILKIDTSKFTQAIDEKTQDITNTPNEKPTTQIIQEKIQKGTEELSKVIKDSAKEVISETIEEKIDESTKPNENSSTKE